LAIKESEQRVKCAIGECWPQVYLITAKTVNLRFTAVEDLKPFKLELLSYFEAPPFQEALGNRDVITVLREALPIWKAETL
jgi:hypothetical protein